MMRQCHLCSLNLLSHGAGDWKALDKNLNDHGCLFRYLHGYPKGQRYEIMINSLSGVTGMYLWWSIVLFLCSL